MELWAHQKEAVERARNLPGYALFFDMGTGKTATAIRILDERVQTLGRQLRVLIFCPPLVVPQWKEQLKTFSLTGLTGILLTGPGKKRWETFQRNAFKFDGGRQPGAFITNYESLLMKDLFNAMKNWAPDVVIYDESHRIKNPSAQRTKKAIELSDSARSSDEYKTYLLSGTPVLNSPMDLFSQVKALFGSFPVDIGYSVTNFYQFRAMFFRDRNVGMPKHKYFPNWELMTREKDGVDALGKISEILASFSMSVKLEDCIDLPGERTIPLYVDLAPEQARVYQELKQDFVAYVGGKACVATMALTKAMRLMQIASGFVALEDDHDRVTLEFEDNPKAEALSELLEELTPGHKVLVWAVWRKNYATIRKVCDALKIRYCEVHGDLTEAQKMAAVESFQTDPGVRILLGNPHSCGIGLCLTCAPYSVFYSVNFSLEDFLQARRRNYRGGQKEKVTHYELRARGTLDDLVFDRLGQKEEMANRITDLAKLI